MGHIAAQLKNYSLKNNFTLCIGEHYDFIIKSLRVAQLEYCSILLLVWEKCRTIDLRQNILLFFCFLFLFFLNLRDTL